jgi:hypothetical protein
MPFSFKDFLKRAAQGANTIVSQVIVSVAAATCMAVITNAYLDQKTPPPAPSETQSLPLQQAPAAPQAMAEPQKPAVSIKESRVVTVNRRAKPVTEAPVVAAVQPVAAGTHATEIFPEKAPGVPLDLAPPPAVAEEPRARLLGLPLPRFVPTVGDVAQSVAAAKDRVVSIVPDWGARD